jgi:isocitrate dehydrogenase
VAELNAVQGHPVDIGGYYYPSPDKLKEVMCPSATFNAALKSAA